MLKDQRRERQGLRHGDEMSEKADKKVSDGYLLYLRPCVVIASRMALLFRVS